VEGGWSAFSKCSAACDGGIKLRTREIITHPTRGGAPCGEITETEECNIESCDPDCVLYDWSEWSTCSKACDTGHRHRIRSIEKQAQGTGTCPAVEGPQRFHEEECNTAACVKTSGIEQVTCTAKVDVAFLIDGSGSLGQAAFDLEKKFVKSFGTGLQTADSQMAVILFSGPKYWSQFYKCSEDPSMSLTDDYLRSDCGLYVESPLTSNIADLIKEDGTIDSMPYPASTTFTSGALRLAAVHLNMRDSSRAGVERVVVVLTDGTPIDKWNTKQAAKDLRADGIRIVVVPMQSASFGISSSGWKTVEKMASDNKMDNIVEVMDPAELGEISTVDTLVEDVCGQGISGIIGE